MNAPPNPPLHSGPDPPAAAEEALRLLGDLDERRVPVYHLDEVAAHVRALDEAWEAKAPPDLLARLQAERGAARLLAPAVLLEEDQVVLVVTAPRAVCAAFDDRAGRLDSHTEFGR